MKIRATVLVDVDPAKWREVFGDEDVRGNVLDYIQSTLQGSAGMDEAEADVTVKR